MHACQFASIDARIEIAREKPLGERHDAARRTSCVNVYVCDYQAINRQAPLLLCVRMFVSGESGIFQADRTILDDTAALKLPRQVTRSHVTPRDVQNARHACHADDRPCRKSADFRGTKVHHRRREVTQGASRGGRRARE